MRSRASSKSASRHPKRPRPYRPAPGSDLSSGWDIFVRQKWDIITRRSQREPADEVPTCSGVRRGVAELVIHRATLPHAGGLWSRLTRTAALLVDVTVPCDGLAADSGTGRWSDSHPAHGRRGVRLLSVPGAPTHPASGHVRASSSSSRRFLENRRVEAEIGHDGPQLPAVLVRELTSASGSAEPLPANLFQRQDESFATPISRRIYAAAATASSGRSSNAIRPSKSRRILAGVSFAPLVRPGTPQDSSTRESSWISPPGDMGAIPARFFPAPTVPFLR